MYFVYLILSLVVAYLFGSINFAILLTRLVRGKDIRELGNTKPGTANVGRSIGKGWGAIVFFMDVAKAVGPMLIARRFFFPAFDYADFFALFLVGIASILGHCKPLFFGFRGGGGIATAIGTFGFFIPFELFFSMVLGFAIIMLFVRNVEYRIGQGVSFMFVSITPIMTLVLGLIVEVPIAGRIGIGGHEWYVIVGVFAVTLLLHGINLRLITEQIRGMRGGGGGE